MQVKQTKTLEAVFAAGCREARRRHADEVTLDHLFLAILKQEGGHASHLLKRLLKEWELYQIKIRLERELGPVVLPDTPLNISCPDVRFDENALLEQMRMSGPCMVQDTCNTGHLLQVIVDDRSSRSSRILVLYNVTSEKIVSYLGDMPPNEDYYEDMQYLSLLGEENGEHPERLVSGVMRIAVTDGQPAAKDSMLGQFGVDLTNCAAEGKLDPVIGRDAEIERVIQILGRRKKNNPVLIGEAGVGKSAIIEGLALRITQKKVPHALLHKRIFSLDVASLVAGTKYRGQFEERINLLLKELSGSDVILFIDEIHRLSRAVEEVLYSALEDYALDIILGKGPSARSIRLDLAHFTLIGATTRYGQLSGPLRDRLSVPLKLDLYSVEDLARIVTRSAGVLGVSVEPDGAVEIASRSRGTPRVANRLLKRVRDFAQVEGDGVITESMARRALSRLEVDELGLDGLDKRLLTAIIQFYGGGPVGLETLAATVGEEAVTIEEVCEPYLLQIGFLNRTPRGRCATKLAYEHLGMEFPAASAAQLSLDGETSR